MLTERANRLSHDALFGVSERLHVLDTDTSNQIARIEKALTTANVLMKLAAMDPSLTAYISAAETTSDLVQRLVIAQGAADKEVELQMDVQTAPLSLPLVEKFPNSLQKAAKVEHRDAEERRNEKRVSKTPSRSSSRSVCLISQLQ